MHVQLRDYDFEGANSGSDGRREFGETLKKILDPLTNDVVRDDFVKSGIVMAEHRCKDVVHISISGVNIVSVNIFFKLVR